MTLPDLDRLHAERRKNANAYHDWNDAIADAYPALRAYLKALEAERDARSIVDREVATDGCCDACDVHMKRLKAARRATDAARAKMEKQDG